MNTRDLSPWFKRSLSRTCVIVFFVIVASMGYGGEFDHEIKTYKEELQKNPQNVEVMIELARRLGWNGELEEALRYYQEVLKLQPDHVEAEIGIATVASWQKKYSEAVRLFQKILKKYPDNVDARVGLGRVYSWMGDTKASVAEFRKALEYAPDYKEALIGLGRVYSWGKEYAKSEEAYKKILLKSPKDIEVLRGLANTYKWGEQYTKGIHIELKILDLQPNDVDSMLSIGYMYGQLGDIARSIYWYEKATKLAPDRGDIHAHLGLLYTRNQQIDSAATAFKKAISLQELDIQSYISLGRVYSWQDKMEDAEKLYKKALEINPQSAGAHAGLGQLYYFNGLWDKSIASYEKSLKLDPFYVEALQGIQRVKLLKAPAFTSRYTAFVNNYRDTLTNVRINKEYVHTVSEEFIYKYAPGKAIEGRAQFSQTAFNNTDKDINFDREPKSRDYLYDEYTLSLRLDYPLWRDRLFFSSRFDQIWFVGHEIPHVFNLTDDQHFPAGFALLKYETKRFVGLGSYSREAVTSTAPKLLFVDPLDTYSLAASYDFTDDLSLIGNYFFQNYEKHRRFRDRREFRAISQYRLPFMKQFELGYEFHHRNHPNQLRNVGSVRFTDRFFKDGLLIDASYTMQAENASDDFGMTYKHIFRLFDSIKLKEWLYFNSDVSIQQNLGHNRGQFQTYRVYLTLLFEKDTMKGKYRVHESLIKKN